MNELKLINCTQKCFKQNDDEIIVINERYSYKDYQIDIHMTHVWDLQAEGIMRISDLKSYEELAYTHIDTEYFEHSTSVQESYILKILKDYESGKLRKIYYM